jgi:hypothetical protein
MKSARTDADRLEDWAYWSYCMIFVELYMYTYRESYVNPEGVALAILNGDVPRMVECIFAETPFTVFI